MYSCGKFFIPFRLPQISCFTLSLKCFSFDSDNCPALGIRPLLQFPQPPRAGPVLLTFLFFPLVLLCYWVLHGSTYSFPLIKHSCLFSAGILHALLCLKVYSWCIRGERCTSRLPTCSSAILFSPESFLNMAPVPMDYICKMEYVGINFRQERGGERVAKRWQLGMYSSCYFTGWETIQIDETCCIWCKLGC